MLNGFVHSFGTLPLLSNAKTRSICPEHPTGEPGKGGMATEGVSKSRATSAGLGQGWKISPYYNIEPGQCLELASIDGPGIIQSLWFAGGYSRELILRIYWDNQDNPSVECPLTEFFAYSWHRYDAYRISGSEQFAGPFFQLNSIPVNVNPNRGFNCFWPMPFRKHCRITLENRGRFDYRAFYQINYALTEVPDDAAYFHAYFRRTKAVPTNTDYIIIDDVAGRGQYVGTALFVGLNGAGNWWGEGEIKFFMDDDKDFPTICGTGTEDYFGGAYDWDVDGVYHMYSAPYMGVHQIVQPDHRYQCQQRFSMYRWHIMDPVRFDKRLKVTIQDLGWDIPREKYLSRNDDFASVAYWYQTLPHVPFGDFPSADEIAFV